MKDKIIAQLLNTNPWTEYRVRLDLLDEPEDSSLVRNARQKMICHPQVKSLITELKNWPGKVLNSHKSAGQHYHKLSFLADLGIKYTDPGMNIIIEKIFEHISSEGPFQLPMNIPVHFGGCGKDEYAWALCDAPVIVYSLVKIGLQKDERVIKAKEYLIGLGRENGYPCAASKELGKFRGPGKAEDPCPYATLIMLKLMSLFDTDRISGNAESAVHSLLHLWEKSTSLHPYIFYMGTDFRKLKAPFIWYDILHLADTASNFEFALKDIRFIEIIDLIKAKAGPDGLYTPESVWMAWKGWDFGQKKEPSPWLTFLVYMLLKKFKSF